MPSLSFHSLALDAAILSNLDTLGFKQMTDIQAQSLPTILAGNDVIGEAKTGSGKTLAFALGVLKQLEVKSFGVQSLIICPTRELADQVAKVLRELARAIQNIKVLTLCGGIPMHPQVNSLKQGAHIIVGTPGRIEAHIRKGHLSLLQLKTFVLDEADRMLDMGFAESIDNIVEAIPAKRQTLLFSATFPDAIALMAQRVASNPLHVKVAFVETHNQIEQQFYYINDTDRFDAIKQLLLFYSPQQVLIFCNTKQETGLLARELRSSGFSALPLNGDLDQKDRDKTLIQFSNQSLSILVATDVAARGLDIESLPLVINSQIARDLQVHIHRIGRTGRAENKGIACTLYDANEKHKKTLLAEYLGYPIKEKILPEIKIYSSKILSPSMKTLIVNVGKKQKIRPGDIVGALTQSQALSFNDIGKIHITPHQSFVAITKAKASVALKTFAEGKLKGRSCKAKLC